MPMRVIRRPNAAASGGGWRARLPLAGLCGARLLLAVAAWVVSCGVAISPAGAFDDADLAGSTMGTTWTVRLAGTASHADRATMQSRIEDVLEGVNAAMSTWRPDSELSRFNAADTTDWFDVSTETVRVVEEALRIGKLSGGAFDVTVGPLVNLWSFGPGGRTPQIPDEAEVAGILADVGNSLLEVRHEPPALRKQHPRLAVDLSAIAKGFGVDRVAAVLEELGATDYMVEIGGEVRTRGHRADGAAWRIGLEAPTRHVRRLHRVLHLSGVSLATSGDYRNFIEVDGRRFSHTIDPRTGWPVEHQLASASVIAATCMEADALATTLMVLGPEAGFAWATEHGVAALLMERNADGTFAERATEAFTVALAAAESSVDGSAPPAEKQSSSAAVFLVAGLVFLLAFAGMAAGVILSNRRLKGSCGGLAGLRDEAGNVLCESCGTPSPDCSGDPVAGEPGREGTDGGPGETCETAAGCEPVRPPGCAGDAGNCEETACPLRESVRSSKSAAVE